MTAQATMELDAPVAPGFALSAHHAAELAAVDVPELPGDDGDVVLTQLPAPSPAAAASHAPAVNAVTALVVHATANDVDPAVASDVRVTTEGLDPEKAAAVAAFTSNHAAIVGLTQMMGVAGVDVLLRARENGEILERLKKSMSHGKWLKFVERHLPVGARAIQNYLRVARGWSLLEPEVERAKGAPDAHFTYSRALKFLRAPKRADKPAGRQGGLASGSDGEGHDDGSDAAGLIIPDAIATGDADVGRDHSARASTTIAEKATPDRRMLLSTDDAKLLVERAINAPRSLTSEDARVLVEGAIQALDDAPPFTKAAFADWLRECAQALLEKAAREQPILEISTDISEDPIPAKRTKKGAKKRRQAS